MPTTMPAARAAAVVAAAAAGTASPPNFTSIRTCASSAVYISSASSIVVGFRNWRLLVAAAYVPSTSSAGPGFGAASSAFWSTVFAARAAASLPNFTSIRTSASSAVYISIAASIVVGTCNWRRMCASACAASTCSAGGIASDAAAAARAAAQSASASWSAVFAAARAASTTVAAAAAPPMYSSGTRATAANMATNLSVLSTSSSRSGTTFSNGVNVLFSIILVKSPFPDKTIFNILDVSSPNT